MSDSREKPNSPEEERLSKRMSVEEIARRLEIGRLAVYAMLERGIMPGIRLGRRWIITRHASSTGSARAECGPELDLRLKLPQRYGVELMPVYKRKYQSG